MDNIITNFKAAWYAFEILMPVAVFCLFVIVFLSYVYKKYIRCRFWRSSIVFGVFSAFGATIGLFVGASKSDIVSSLLPPIITLISGYLAYLGSRDLPVKIKALLPGGVFALLVSLLYSAFYMKSWYNFVSQ